MMNNARLLCDCQEQNCYGHWGDGGRRSRRPTGFSHDLCALVAGAAADAHIAAATRVASSGLDGEGGAMNDQPLGWREGRHRPRASEVIEFTDAVAAGACEGNVFACNGAGGSVAGASGPALMPTACFAVRAVDASTSSIFWLPEQQWLPASQPQCELPAGAARVKGWSRRSASWVARPKSHA
jgi:hypothetical protein